MFSTRTQILIIAGIVLVGMALANYDYSGPRELVEIIPEYDVPRTYTLTSHVVAKGGDTLCLIAMSEGICLSREHCAETLETSRGDLAARDDCAMTFWANRPAMAERRAKRCPRVSDPSTAFCGQALDTLWPGDVVDMVYTLRVHPEIRKNVFPRPAIRDAQMAVSIGGR